MFKYEYLWIVVLVLIFETIALIPFKKKHLDNDSISICVILGNLCGIVLGTIFMSIIGVILGSFCKFMGVVDYKEIVTNVWEIGIVASSFIGYISALISEWD